MIRLEVDAAEGRTILVALGLIGRTYGIGTDGERRCADLIDRLTPLVEAEEREVIWQNVPKIEIDHTSKGSGV